MKILTFILIIQFGVSLGQTKLEYEKKVDESEIPYLAKKDLYNCFNEDVKVRWFLQKDGEKQVYEAKFDYNGSYYSVEFDLEGKIENVEVLLDEKDMETATINNILTSIGKEFSDFKVLKIQREFKGQGEELFAILRGESTDDIEINYEIEVNVKLEKRRELYEVILDDEYKVLSKRKIKLQSTDVLDY